MASNTPFKHQPLDLDRSEIRLFRLLSPRLDKSLEGEITIFDTEHCPSYTAVSYTWGPPSPTREILVDGQSLTIRENLWHFLNTTHDYSDALLWIDQICIDQTAVDERNHQVSLMASIFAGADVVLIWLGVEANGSTEAIDAIKSGFSSMMGHKQQVRDLFERPYWDRLWIIQEVLMSRNALVLCGNRSFSWKQLTNMYVPTSEKGSTLVRPVELKETVLSLITEKKMFKKQRLSFVISTFAGSECEDPRDKVYGLLSLVQSSGVIPIDYSKTTSDVFYDAIQRIIQEETLMDTESHFDVAQHLRDSMNLGIEDLSIYTYVKERRKSGAGGAKDMLWAASEGHQEILRLLIDTGNIDVNAKDEIGRTPLMRAAPRGHRDAVELLLGTGKVDANAKAKDGWTALMLAAVCGNEDVVKLLLSADDVDLDAGDKTGWTALMYAAGSGHAGVVKLLLSTGRVDVDAETEDSWTALRWAEHNGYHDIARLLEPHQDSAPIWLAKTRRQRTRG